MNGIDLKEAEANFEGDRSLLLECIEIFLHEWRERWEQSLSLAIERRDSVDLSKIGHDLQSPLGSLGARAGGRIVTEMVEKGRAGQWTEVGDGLDALKAEVACIGEQLKAMKE